MIDFEELLDWVRTLPVDPPCEGHGWDLIVAYGQNDSFKLCRTCGKSPEECTRVM
jgi:hypothetical protein